MFKKMLVLALIVGFVGCGAIQTAFGAVTATEIKRQYFDANGSLTTFTFTMPVNSSDDNEGL